MSFSAITTDSACAVGFSALIGFLGLDCTGDLSLKPLHKYYCAGSFFGGCFWVKVEVDRYCPFRNSVDIGMGGGLDPGFYLM
jgi:hypothetical protein